MNNTPTLSVDEEKRQAITEIEQRAQIRRDFETRLAQLTKVVTTAETVLVEFEGKKSFFQSRKQQLQASLLQLWPKQPADITQTQTSAVQLIVESWGTILAIDAALADAPRVKRHLDEQLHAAKQALADFSALPRINFWHTPHPSF